MALTSRVRASPRSTRCRRARSRRSTNGRRCSIDTCSIDADWYMPSIRQRHMPLCRWMTAKYPATASCSVVRASPVHGALDSASSSATTVENTLAKASSLFLKYR